MRKITKCRILNSSSTTLLQILMTLISIFEIKHHQMKISKKEPEKEKPRKRSLKTKKRCRPLQSK